MADRFDWDDLRPFLAVARTGTVSAASRRLSVDHATIIRRIEALERALAAKLFERTPRGYNLTQRGERLLLSAEAIEAEALKVGREIGASQQTVAGLVRISALEGFGNFFFAPRLARFAQSHPHLAIELVTLQQIVALSRREADIAVTLHPPATGRYFREPLTDYFLYLYGSKDYLQAHPPIRCRADLESHAFCGYIDDLVFVRGLDYLDEVGRGVRATLRSSSIHAQMEAVTQGYGLGVLPAFVAAHRPGLVRVLPDEIVLKRSYWLVANNEVAGSPRVQAVRSFLRREVDEAGDLFGGAPAPPDVQESPPTS